MSATTERIHAFDEARKAAREPFKVKDLSLAEFGRKEIRLAEQEMPGLMAVRQRYAAKKNHGSANRSHGIENGASGISVLGLQDVLPQARKRVPHLGSLLVGLF